MDTLKFAEDLHRADAMLLSDVWPKNAHAIFFHARAHSDDDQLFALVKDYYHLRTQKPFVFINGADGSHRNGMIPGESWKGAGWWAKQLLAHGVEMDQIICTRDAFNTKEENNEFVRLARHCDARSALVVTQPHQLVRCFLGLLKSMSDLPYELRVYAYSPRHKDTYLWWREIYSYSAALAAETLPPPEERMRSRFECAGAEVPRILEYQKKGDLATFDELFEYLRRRERIV